MKKLLIGLLAIGGVSLATPPEGGVNLVPNKEVNELSNVKPNITTQDTNLGSEKINYSKPLSSWELANIIKNNIENTDISEDKQIISQVVGTTSSIEKTYNVSCLYWDGDFSFKEVNTYILGEFNICS